MVNATDEPEFYTESRFNAWLALADSLNIKVNVSETVTPHYKCSGFIFPSSPTT